MFKEVKYQHPKIIGKSISTTSKVIYIKYNKNNYIIGIHHGYPVSTICIDDMTESIDGYTICNWNEILFKSVTPTEDQFVFNNFNKKQIDSKQYYYCGTKRFQYVDKYYFPINMLPNNPKNMYYMMKCLNDTIKPGDSGSPIYNQDKQLIGIISKTKNDTIFVIPVIYILNSILKNDNNNIYMIKCRDLKNIDMYNVKNNKIYHPSLKTYIYTETYFTLEGDKDKKLLINNMDANYELYINKINSHKYISSNNKIIITSGFLNILKLINKELLIIIFRNLKNKTNITFDNYELIFI